MHELLTCVAMNKIKNQNAKTVEVQSNCFFKAIAQFLISNMTG